MPRAKPLATDNQFCPPAVLDGLEASRSKYEWLKQNSFI
jgi:hypothetical protein